MEAQAYVHRHSGELVHARQFTERQQWVIHGSTSVTNPYTKAQEFPTETVEAGDWEVIAGKVGISWGNDKEQKFIVPKWVFPLCYVSPEGVNPPGAIDVPAEVASEAPQVDLNQGDFTLY